MKLNHWDLAAIFMALITAAETLAQNFAMRVFPLAFEVCIFYLPLTILIAVAVGVRSKSKGS